RTQRSGLIRGHFHDDCTQRCIPRAPCVGKTDLTFARRSEEHTSELQSLTNLVCRLLLEKKKKHNQHNQETTKQNINQTITQHRGNTPSIQYNVRRQSVRRANLELTR